MLNYMLCFRKLEQLLFLFSPKQKTMRVVPDICVSLLPFFLIINNGIKATAKKAIFLIISYFKLFDY